MPRSLVQRGAQRFKRRFWGRTFRCPVCHLELALHDTDENGLVVCPLCGVVIEVDTPYGHTVPVVHDVEINRPQPKLRIHPMATHAPIGLYPLALVGALLLVLGSVVALPSLGLDRIATAVERPARLLEQTTLVLLALSVGLSTITFASGLRDWTARYRRRPYRQIRLKIAFSMIFLAVGTLAVGLHASGWVFSASTGLMDLGSPLGVVAGLAYLLALAVGMVVLATLGHVGGNLVFGR